MRSGGCNCGAVRYQAAGNPTRAGLCHCQTCRRETGSAFMAFAVWPSDAVRVSGSMDREATSSDVPFLLAAGPGWRPQSYREGLWLTLHTGRHVRGTTVSSPVLMHRRRQVALTVRRAVWGRTLSSRCSRLDVLQA
nr:GFA family protein [Methylobacterium sp. ZNC0032]